MLKARQARSKLTQQRKQIENEFKKVDPLPKEITEEIKEEVREEKIGPDSGWKTTVTFGAKETTDDELPSPEQLHDDAMRLYAKLWEALANIDHLPADSTDVFVDSIKATRDHRLRMLKGLDAVRRTGFINQTTWLQKLLTDILQQDTQLIKEEKPTGR